MGTTNDLVDVSDGGGVAFAITSDEEDALAEEDMDTPDFSEEDEEAFESILDMGYKRTSMASRMCARLSKIFKRKDAYHEVVTS